MNSNGILTAYIPVCEATAVATSNCLSTFSPCSEGVLRLKRGRLCVWEMENLVSVWLPWRVCSRLGLGILRGVPHKSPATLNLLLECHWMDDSAIWTTGVCVCVCVCMCI